MSRPAPMRRIKETATSADDEQTAKAIALRARSGITAAFFQRVVQIEVRCLLAGARPKIDSGQRATDAGKDEHRGVDIDRSASATSCRNKSLQDVSPAKARSKPSTGAQQREQYAFG